MTQNRLVEAAAAIINRMTRTKVHDERAQRLQDFLGHLMADSHDFPVDKDGNMLSEASMDLNLLKKPKKTPAELAAAKESYIQKSKLKVTGIQQLRASNPRLNTPVTLAHPSQAKVGETPNLLQHPGVTQNDTSNVTHQEHTERYQALMSRGKHIADSHAGSGGTRKVMERGFNNYMSGVSSGEDPRQTQKPQLREARAAAAKHYGEIGYGESAFKFISGNTKTEKNLQLGDSTAGLALSPANIHGMGGHNSCPKATKECRYNCLFHTTGQNAMLSNINSKIAHHQFMAEHPEHASRMIHAELLDHVDKTAEWNQERKKKGEEPMIASYRPNMVSDYDHHTMSGAMIDHVTEYAKRKGVKFQVRDYTKRADLLRKPRASNYFLALSHTGSNHPESNDREVGKALNDGHTVASVVAGNATHFYDHSNERLYPIAEGDDDDQIERRHATVGHKVREDGTGVHPETNKPTGVVSALRIKGLSHEMQKAAGLFENQTTTINHPVHGPMNVVEINKMNK